MSERPAPPPEYIGSKAWEAWEAEMSRVAQRIAERWNKEFKERDLEQEIVSWDQDYIGYEGETTSTKKE